MAGGKRRRTVAAAAVGVVLAGSVGLLVTDTAGRPDSAGAAEETCGVLFDDFHYRSPTDTDLAGRWTTRTTAGHPGVEGATWSADGVSFPTVDGDPVMQLSASTDGTPAGTKQVQVASAQDRYREGTYAARIHLTDAPASGGQDGDHVVQTFYAQMLNGDAPEHANLDPNYSELDFIEYLPNGGWGETGAKRYQTSWHTYQKEPWQADNKSTSQSGSTEGWHDVVVQVYQEENAPAGTDPYHVRYYLDGQLLADHQSTADKPGYFFPRTDMTINWNVWFPDNNSVHPGVVSTYHELVDYVLFVDKVRDPEQMTRQAAGYRSDEQAFVDSVAAPAACPVDLTGPTTSGSTLTPSVTATTPPTSAASLAPTASAPSSAPTASSPAPAATSQTATPSASPSTGSMPTICITFRPSDAGSSTATAPAWAPCVSYRTGDVVTHGNQRFRCIQGHGSLSTWEPSIYTRALWTPLS